MLGEADALQVAAGTVAVLGEPPLEDEAADAVDLAELMEVFRGRMSEASRLALVESGSINPRVRGALLWMCGSAMGQQVMLSIGGQVDGAAVVAAVDTLKASSEAAPELLKEARETLSELQQLEHLQKLQSEGMRVLEDHAPEYHAMQSNITGLLQELGTSDAADGLKARSSELLTKVKDSDQLQQLMAKARALMQSDKAQSLLQSAIGASGKVAIETMGSEVNGAEGGGDAASATTGYSAERMVNSIKPMQSSVLKFAKENEKLQAMAEQAMEYLPSAGDQAASLMASGNTLVSQLRESQQGQEWMRKGMEYLDTHGEDQIQRGLSLLEQVDVEKAFDYGEQVVSDGDARALFISKAKDAALDFALRQLPSIVIPPITAEKDGIAYSLGAIDMSSFKILKEHVSVQLGDLSRTLTGDDPLLHLHIDGISASIRNLDWEYQQNYFPFFGGSGSTDADVEDASLTIDFELRRAWVDPAAIAAAAAADAKDGGGGGDRGDGAASPPPIPARTSAAALPSASTTLSTVGSSSDGGGSSGTDSTASAAPHWEPRLVVSNVEVKMADLRLRFEGNSLYTWLAHLFQGTVKDYITKTLTSSCRENLTALIAGLNGYIAPVLPAILSISSLVGAGDLESSIMRLSPIKDESGAAIGAGGVVAHPAGKEFTMIVRTKKGRIGFLLAPDERFGGRFLRIDRLVRSKDGGKLPAELAGVQVGDLLVQMQRPESTCATKQEHLASVVPLRLAGGKTVGDLARLIGGAERPIALLYVTPADPLAVADATRAATTKSANGDAVVTFTEASIGLNVAQRSGGQPGVMVTGFPEGRPSPARECGEIKVGQVLLSVNETDVRAMTFKSAMKVFAHAGRPITLAFGGSADFTVELADGAAYTTGNRCPESLGLLLEQVSVPGESGTPSVYVVVVGFQRLRGPAECAGLKPLQPLFEINGRSVRGRGFSAAIDLVRECRKTGEPLMLGFGPVGSLTAQSLEEFSTTSHSAGTAVPSVEQTVQFSSDEPIGIVFERATANFCPRIKELSTFKGPADKCREIRPGHVLRRVGDVAVTDLEQAYALIMVSPGKTQLHFRDMERYLGKQARSKGDNKY